MLGAWKTLNIKRKNVYMVHEKRRILEGLDVS